MSIFSRNTILFSCPLVIPCISRTPNSSLRDCRKEPTDTSTNSEENTKIIPSATIIVLAAVLRIVSLVMAG
ncbi:hypothetical protein D3C75_787300 [compost metagenome]